MHLFNFGNSSGYKILSISLIKQIHKKITEKLSLNIFNFSYKHYNSTDLHEINKNNYVIRFSTKGHKYYLFMTIIDYTKYCIFINKKTREYVIVIYNFEESIFNDTLLDGEILKNKNKKWIFLVNDMLLYNGNNIKNMTIETRLDMVNKLFTEEYNEHISTYTCYIIPKIYLDKKYIHSLFIEMKKFSFECNGIVFKKTTGDSL